MSLTETIGQNDLKQPTTERILSSVFFLSHRLDALLQALFSDCTLSAECSTVSWGLCILRVLLGIIARRE